MTETRYELMKEAYELVKGYHNTYKLFKELGNAYGLITPETAQSTFDQYDGARGLFEKLFKIDYYDARHLFEYFEVPF